MSSHSSNGEVRMIEGLVNVDTVVDHRDALIESIKSEGCTTFDLADLKVHGSAVIAMLISVVRESRKLGHEVSFVNCPVALLEIAEACGVREFLPVS